MVGGDEGGGPGGGVVPGLVVLPAPPQPAEELVSQVAEGRVMAVADGSALVVVGSCAWRLGEGGECPPVAGVGETTVADVACLHDFGAPRGPGDRGSPSEAAQVLRGGKAGSVVADLA